MPEPTRTVAILTLGCARNEVDSEELAGRLESEGWTLVEDASEADVAVVNTCGFVEQAKKDSIDALLEASDLKDTGRTQAVVAVGCLAERYGKDLAESMPEADAVLGFDSYQDMSTHLRTILAGGSVEAHTPDDRRRLLPLSPADRQGAAGAIPGHASHATVPAPASTGIGSGFGTPEELAAAGIGVTMTEPEVDLLDERAPASGPSQVIRHRLDGRPWAPLKIASGCDRRCAFCAIPSFRGSFVSRRPTDVLAEARWLGAHDVKEVFLVSENTTSYGKDLGDLRLLDRLLPEIAAVDGIERVRVSYLQPAEVRPDLLDAMTGTPGVVPYFDLSFQHASAPLLRRMRRFGSADAFLDLLEQVRARAPHAGIRSNVIVGFPGETEADLAELERFLTAARLDVVGVFAYSDEEGTEGERLDGHVDPAEVAERVERITSLVNELMDQRAEERIGERVSVLVEEIVPDDEDPDATPFVVGRAEHQGPDVDGVVTFEEDEALAGLAPGMVVTGVVTANEGVDLIARLES